MPSTSRRTFVCGLAGATATVLGCASGNGAKPANSSAPAGSAAPGEATSGSSAGVPTRRLGKTGESVSMLGLGGFHVGKQAEEAESIALIRRAIDSGITFLDNCWDYNKGQSEIRMGKALADGYRQRAFLMTKIDGRTRESALAQLEQSLSRLRTEMIDLVQIHEIIRVDDPARCFAPGGTIEALIAAREAGKLRFIGFTGHKDPAIHLSMLELAARHRFAFDTVQMPLNVMDAHYKSFEREVLPVLVEQEIGVLGMKSMGSGDILQSGVVAPEECLRYALSLPTSVVISGMDNREVLEKNLQIARNFRALADEERQALLARSAAAAREGKHELFKTSEKFDGTAQNPHWLEGAQI
jgi:aryl-alcohol dehydrogenase-like predicted oxidoreductase